MRQLDATADAIAASCAAAGLDLMGRGRRGSYDAEVDAEHRFDAPPGHGALLVIGNTRSVWAPFLAWLAERPERYERADPLDDYAAEVVHRAIAGLDARAFELHERARPRLSAAKLARVTGLASVGPAGLVAHREHGPWMALRAAVLLPGDGWDEDPILEPCAGCPAPCAEALSRALASEPTIASDVTHGDIVANWRDWVAVRDACPVGEASRYGEAQLAYHYTKDPTHLRS